MLPIKRKWYDFFEFALSVRGKFIDINGRWFA